MFSHVCISLTIIYSKTVKEQKKIIYPVCGHARTRPLNGDERDRTADPLLARQVLSQLSYAPDVNPSWAYLDLNQGPHAYQACALTS